MWVYVSKCEDKFFQILGYDLHQVLDDMLFFLGLCYMLIYSKYGYWTILNN